MNQNIPEEDKEYENDDSQEKEIIGRKLKDDNKQISEYVNNNNNNISELK